MLARLLADQPQLRHLMLHNIDTLGADADPAMFGLHLAQGAGLTFEVITRRLEDRGGGLARVNGQVRLVEGLAMPREEDEFALSYYNSNTCWIDIDRLLTAFGLARGDLTNMEKVTAAVRALAARVPTYVTIKDVKKRWGQGQEDIFPVSQFEKLWVDMTALPEIKSRFVVVPRSARTTTQGPVPTGRLAPRRFSGACRTVVPMGVVDGAEPSPSLNTLERSFGSPLPNCAQPVNSSE